MLTVSLYVLMTSLMINILAYELLVFASVAFVIAMWVNILMVSFLPGHRLDFVKYKIGAILSDSYNIGFWYRRNLVAIKYMTQEDAIETMTSAYGVIAMRTKWMGIINCNFCLTVFTCVCIGVFHSIDALLLLPAFGALFSKI